MRWSGTAKRNILGRARRLARRRKGGMMDTANFRDLAVEEFDTRTLLSHANAQAVQRRYEDFFIADVDGHHWEMISFPQIAEFIEDPVLRQQAKYQGYGGGGITAPSGSYQE